MEKLRVDLLTREYPPEVYGGAGVHLEYLARDLRRLGPSLAGSWPYLAATLVQFVAYRASLAAFGLETPEFEGG